MLFGQSLFQSVLERLKEEAEVLEEPSAGSFRIHGLGASFVTEEVRDSTAEMERGQSLYREMMEAAPPPLAPEVSEPEPDDTPPAPPAHLMRQSPDEIATDLGIRPSDTAAVLADKRRAFARLNHPDGFPQEFRDLANMRMKVANLLVDEAVRRLAG